MRLIRFVFLLLFAAVLSALCPNGKLNAMDVQELQEPVGSATVEPAVLIHAGRGEMEVVTPELVSVEIATLSNRTVVLWLTPKSQRAERIGLKVEGLHRGDYRVEYTGFTPRLVNQRDFRRPILVTLPPAMPRGESHEDLNSLVKMWLNRLESVQKQVPASDRPAGWNDLVSKMRNDLHEIARNLDLGGRVALRITPAGAGAVALPAVTQPGEEWLDRAIQHIRALAQDLVHNTGLIENQEIKSKTFEILCPVTFTGLSGGLMNLSVTGNPGTGMLLIGFRNESANPRVRIDARLTIPQEWKISESEDTMLELAAGKEGVLEYEITIPGGHWGIGGAVLEARITAAGVSIHRRMELPISNRYIRTWSIIGPFPNDTGKGFDTAYPPEAGIDLEAEYPGVEGKPVRWRRIVSSTDKIDFLPLFEPNTNVVCYAHVAVQAPKRSEVRFLLGSDDGAKVWLNGEYLFGIDIGRGAAPGQDVFTGTLKEGWNDLLVKVIQGAGSWELYLEMQSPDGGTIPGVRLRTR